MVMLGFGGGWQRFGCARLSRFTKPHSHLQEDFPAGKGIQVAKIKPSDLEAWLAKYGFGYASHNLYVECVRAIFRMGCPSGSVLKRVAQTLIMSSLE